MAKSKGRLLAELLASDGKVKESKSALDISGGKLAPSDIPTLPISKLEHNSISIAGHNTSLGGSVSLNTGDITEHTQYKYYTDERVRSAISASGDLSYNSNTGVISFSASDSPVVSVNTKTGSVVLSTTDIAEGTNKYYTDARVSTRADTILNHSNHSNITVTKVGDQLRFSAAAQYGDSDVGSYLSTNGYATQSTIVGAITDSAPATLDTLNELAAALGDDANFSTTVTNSIATKLPKSGGTMTGRIIQGPHSTTLGNSSYVTEAAITAQATNTTNAYPGYGFHKSGQLGLFLYATNRSTLRQRGDDGTDVAIWNTGDFSSTNVSNWNTAYGWGNHASAGYLTSFDITTQTDSKYLRSNAADTASETITFSKGINVGGLADGGITGSNYNITGVNTLVINDPGEGIQFAGTSNVHMYAIDDANDSIINLQNASELRVNNNKVWTVSNDGSGSGLDADLLDGQHASAFAPIGGSTGRFITGGLYGTGHGSSILPIWQYNAGNPGYGIGYEESSPDRLRMDVTNNLMSGTPDFELIPNELRINGNKVWNAGNDGSGSGLDADTLDGLELHTGRNNEANKVVRTDSNGYIQAGWINTTSGSTTGTNRIYASNDGYIRYVTPATLISNLGLFTTSNDGSGSGLDADLLDGWHREHFTHAEDAKVWTGINASGTQAKRYHIARLYGCPAHWDDNWQNIEFHVNAQSYEAGTLKYKIHGNYGGAGSQANMIKVHLTEAYGDMIPRFRLVLGTPTDAGWDHSGQDTFYVDVFAEASHYSQWKIHAKTYGHTSQSSNPTSGGATTVFYGSPTTTNISTFAETHTQSTIRLDTSNIQTQTAQTKLKAHSNGWEGGLALISQDGSDTFRIHPDNNGYMYVDKNWYFTGDIHVASIGQKVWHQGNDGSGSGLDADLLDGQQLSYVMNYDNLSNKPSNISNSDTVDGLHAASFLRSDAADTGSGKITLTAAEGLEVFGIRGRAVGSQTGDFIQMYERVSIGYPSGWGAGGANSAPTQGLTTYGGALFNTGNVSGAPLTFNGNTIWRADNDGSGSGLDADLLDGYNTSTSATANTVVVREANGHIYGNYILGSYFNATSGNSENPTIGQVWTQSTGDNYLRKSTPAHFKSQLGLWHTGNLSSPWHTGNDGAGSGLDADLLDGLHKSHITRYQSGNDFANGTLVTTNINSGNTNGDSFVIEISGKAYGSSRPHFVIAEGYLYNNSIISTNGSNIGGSNFTYLKVMNISGNLCFWWPRHGYWNSYDVHVRASSSGTSNFNRVTSITNSTDPSSATKKIQINLVTSWTSSNDGSGSGLDADTLDGQNGSYYLAYGNLTGTPTIPSLSGYATESYVNTAVSNLVDSSPSALNTLNELAAALGDDANFSTTVTNSIATKLPLAGGTVTGDLIVRNGNANAALHFRTGNDFVGIGFNRNVATGAIFDSNINAFQMHIQNNKLEFETYNGAGTTQKDGAWILDTAGNQSITGTMLVGGQYSNNSYSTVSSTRLLFGGGNDPNNYHIGTNLENYGGNYTKLDLRWHTGIRMGAQPGYGGIRFFNNEDLGSVLFSIGKGDTNMRVEGGNMLFTGDRLAIFGPNTGYSRELAIGGNGNHSTSTRASIGVTNGNLHIDSASGNATYLNFYDGTSGVAFGSGNTSTVAWMGPDGDLWKGSTDNSGSKYWHAGNDGSGSGLDADLLDGIDSSSFLRSDNSDTFGSTSANQYIRFNVNSGQYIASAGSSSRFPIEIFAPTANGGDAGIAFHVSGDYAGFFGLASDWNDLAWGGWSVGSTTKHRIAHTGNLGTTLSGYWNSSNDGPGSGLDADTVDGKHKDFLMHYKGQVSGNWDTIFSQTDGHMGVYQVTNITGGGHSNYPSGAYGYGGVMSWQLADSTFKLYAPHIGQLHYQTGWNNDEYSGWRKIWDTGNDGSGSGLDADTLDGIQASGFLQAGGGWGAANMPGSRYVGLAVNGGEVAFLRDNPNNAQMSVLADGAFYAGENNGFYSLYSGNSYNSKSGFYADTSGHLQFSAQEYAQFNTQHGNIQLGPMNASYAHIYTNISGGFYFNRTALYANGNTMWHAGNDGSGSGLDADTVDGIHGASFLRSDTTDIMAMSAGTNEMLKFQNNSSGGHIQLGFQQNDSDGLHHRFYIKTYKGSGSASGNVDLIVRGSGGSTTSDVLKLYSGSSASWRNNTIWDAGNDGSGSGLDADLLDGLNSTDYKQDKWYSFTVGGDLDKFYPALFTVTATGYHSAEEIEIAQDNVHQNGSSHGAFWAKFGVNITGWGHIPQVLTLREYSKSGNTYISKMGNVDHATSRVGIWLRGSTTYFYRSNSGAILSGVFCTDNQPYKSYDNSNDAYDITITHATTVEDAIFNSSMHAGKFLNTGNIGSYAWTSSNDGSNSGLDADMLDGQHGSHYLDYNNFTNKPSLSTLGYTGATNANYITNNNQLTNGAGYITASGTANQSHMVSGSALATTGSPSSVLEYQQAASITDTKLAPSGDWHNTIRMGHGNPYSYYSNTIALRMTGSGLGDLYTQTISNNNAQGWNKHWHTNNDGSGSGLDADLLDGINSGSFLRSDTDDTYSGNHLFFNGLSLNISNNNSHGNSAGTYFRGDSSHFVFGLNSGNTLYLNYGNGSGALRTEGTITHNSSLVGTKPWGNSNDGSGSGLDADLLDGYNSAENGGNTIHRLASNGYSQIQNWTNVLNAGLYSTSVNSAHFSPNTVTSYGSWRTSGSRGGYDGIVFDSGGDVALMFDSGGNGGMYRQGGVGWMTYFHQGNDCLGVCDSTTSSTYGLYVTGQIYATSNITAYSDRRVKENIIPIDNALEKVNNLVGVYYNKKDDESKQREIGFIAQDVNEVVPELVTYAEDVDQYGVKYQNTTALLVEAVKELTKQVNDLKKELEEIKNDK